MMPLAFFDHHSEPTIDPGEVDDIVAMQLMCSRICHDLSGPAGAVAAAIEIIGDLNAPDPDAIQLIAESSQVFRSRLSFLRTAFGSGSTSLAESSLNQTIAIANENLSGSRAQLNVICDASHPVDMGKARPGAAVRLILCLTWEASRGLPRGGSIDLCFSERPTSLTVHGRLRGRGAAFPDELKHDVDMSIGNGLTSRNISVYYLRKMLARLGTSIAFSSSGADEDMAVVVIPTADA